MEKQERIAALAERLRVFSYRLEADGADGSGIWRGLAELAIDDLEVLSSQQDNPVVESEPPGYSQLLSLHP